MGSKNWSTDGQLEMPIARRPQKIEMDQTIITAQPTFLAAINLMFNVSGLEEKELYMPLDIDASHWSRIRKGADGAHFPTNKLEAAMDLCNSDIPLQWLAARRGYELRPLLSDIERQLEAERAARIRAEEKLATVTEFMNQTHGRR